MLHGRIPTGQQPRGHFKSRALPNFLNFLDLCFAGREEGLLVGPDPEIRPPHPQDSPGSGFPFQPCRLSPVQPWLSTHGPLLRHLGGRGAAKTKDKLRDGPVLRSPPVTVAQQARLRAETGAKHGTAEVRIQRNTQTGKR